MNDENININNDDNNLEFDNLIQQLKKHSINKRHSKENLNNIIAFALDENRKFENQRKTALANLPQRTKTFHIKEFIKSILGWGRPKVLIPRLAFLASILIIVSVSIFYLSTPDTNINQEELISTTTKPQKDYEQQPLKENYEASKNEFQQPINTKNSNKKNLIKEIHSDRTVQSVEGESYNQPHFSNNKEKMNISLSKRPDAQPSENNSNRSFQFVKSTKEKNFDTIYETIKDTERGANNLGFFDKKQEENEKMQNLNFARYKQILLKYNINSVEENNELITDWFLVKSKTNNVPYHRFLFKTNTQNPSKILIIKEDAHQISDSLNIKILSEKEFNRILELLK
jgi:hypothetical protein